MWNRIVHRAGLGSLWRNDRGSIAVLGALSLSAVLAMSGLAVEISTGYAAKVRNQRVADMAALGAAVAYQAASQSFVVAQATANDIVVANGLAASTATVTQVTVNGQAAIKVELNTSVPIALARVVAGTGSYNVKTAAYAALNNSGTTACILALSNSTSSVTATGGASVSASGCAVVSNGTIASDNSSAKITAKQVVAKVISDTAAQWNQNAITTTPTANNIRIQSNAAVDAIKTGSTAVQTALCYVNQLTGYSDPDYSGGNRLCASQLVNPATYTTASTTDWTTDYAVKASSGFSSYRTADYQCVYNVPAGIYDIRKLTVTGGCTVTFATGSTLTFGAIDMSGDKLVIGDGQVIVTGLFNNNGGNKTDKVTTVGNGYHSFGSLTVGGGKALRIGSGSLNVGGGLAVSGGTWIKVNISANETVTLGKDGSGNSISVSGGSMVCFTSDCAAPTAAAGTFSATGNVSNDGGGSTIVFPKSAMHVINGNLSLSAAAIFGPGLYVIAGNWTNGTGCGGCVMQGTEVTFALGGTFSFGGGTSFDLAAPTAGSSYGITDILIATKSSAATAISAGSSGKASGMIYAPNSAFSSTGGSAISANGSACMMLVVNTIAVSGSGTINTANCASQTTTSGGTASLLQ